MCTAQAEQITLNVLGLNWTRCMFPFERNDLLSRAVSPRMYISHTNVYRTLRNSSMISIIAESRLLLLADRRRYMSSAVPRRTAASTSCSTGHLLPDPCRRQVNENGNPSREIHQKNCRVIGADDRRLFEIRFQLHVGVRIGPRHCWWTAVTT